MEKHGKEKQLYFLILCERRKEWFSIFMDLKTVKRGDAKECSL